MIRCVKIPNIKEFFEIVFLTQILKPKFWTSAGNCGRTPGNSTLCKTFDKSWTVHKPHTALIRFD